MTPAAIPFMPSYCRTSESIIRVSFASITRGDAATKLVAALGVVQGPRIGIFFRCLLVGQVGQREWIRPTAPAALVPCGPSCETRNGPHERGSIQ